MSQIIPPDMAELRGQPPQSDIHSHSHQQSQQQAQQQQAQQHGRDPNLDPKLSGENPNPNANVNPAQVAAIANAAGLQIGAGTTLDSNQILTLLRHLPSLMHNKVGGTLRFL